MRRLIDKGRTWVKLSVTYDNTTDGPPGYADVVALGQSLVKLRRSAWCGAAIGRIQTIRASQMTRCCSISWRDGRLMMRSGIAFWSRIQQSCTTSARGSLAKG